MRRRQAARHRPVLAVLGGLLIVVLLGWGMAPLWRAEASAAALPPRPTLTPQPTATTPPEPTATLAPTQPPATRPPGPTADPTPPPPAAPTPPAATPPPEVLPEAGEAASGLPTWLLAGGLALLAAGAGLWARQRLAGRP